MAARGRSLSVLDISEIQLSPGAISPTFRDGTGVNAYRVVRILSLAYVAKCDSNEIASYFVGVLGGVIFSVGLKA